MMILNILSLGAVGRESMVPKKLSKDLIDEDHKKAKNGKLTPKLNYEISREVLEHLSPLHRLAAEAAIRDGRWRVKD